MDKLFEWLFFVGLGAPGENSLFFFSDQDPSLGINKICLGKNNTSFFGGRAYSEINFSEKPNTNSSSREVVIENKTITVAPFSFELKQEEEQVLLIDFFSKKATWWHRLKKKTQNIHFYLK